MRAVGEVMSIGKNYKEALQKAIRSLEIGRYGLGFAKDFNEKSLEELMGMLAEPSSERQFISMKHCARARPSKSSSKHPHQALVPAADEGTCGTGGRNPSAQGGPCCRTTC
jgi:hypothetical protein